jgi:hypothetical protein
VVLVELGVVEQRSNAVYEALDGASVTDVALAMWWSDRRCTNGCAASPTVGWGHSGRPSLLPRKEPLCRSVLTDCEVADIALRETRHGGKK